MKIDIKDLSFGYGNKMIIDKMIFKDFSLSLDNEGTRDSKTDIDDYRPVVILGPSGCGKTTLLRLIAGTLAPILEAGVNQMISKSSESVSFIFQEPRLLSWFTILENISILLRSIFGEAKARERAMQFLKLVSLENEALSLPDKLSGGQLQRASIARAFAFPSELLLMDEPFQSLDIPLRIELMELCLSLLEKEKRLSILVTHDPREAVFMGRRILVLGHAPKGIVFDENIYLPKEERAYGTATAAEIEKRLIKGLL